jgi:hypothetical protein
MNQPASTTPATSKPPVRKEGADRFSTILTAALCTLLGVNLLVMAFGHHSPASASAQVSGYNSNNPNPVNAVPPSGVIPSPENIPSAPTSSPEMLKRVVEQQVETNARLARIEAQLSNPHAVTVTNWPANIGANPPAPAGGK